MEPHQPAPDSWRHRRHIKEINEAVRHLCLLNIIESRRTTNPQRSKSNEYRLTAGFDAGWEPLALREVASLQVLLQRQNFQPAMELLRNLKAAVRKVDPTNLLLQEPL